MLSDTYQHLQCLTSSFKQHNWVFCEIVVLWKVALVYPNSEPLSFICAFYGCLTAGVIPVPIEVPLSRRVSSAVWVCMHAAFPLSLSVFN